MKRLSHQNHQGALIDVMDVIFEKTKLNFTLDTDWASKESRKTYPMSSYTACCLDVIVQNIGPNDLQTVCIML